MIIVKIDKAYLHISPILKLNFNWLRIDMILINSDNYQTKVTLSESHFREFKHVLTVVITDLIDLKQIHH